MGMAQPHAVQRKSTNIHQNLDRVTAKFKSYSSDKPQNIQLNSCETNWLRRSVTTNYYMSTHNNCDQETNPKYNIGTSL